LASVTELWGVAAFSTLILAFGHLYSYRRCAEPIRWVRGLIFVAFHLTLGWVYVGIVAGLPYPQAQLAMLELAQSLFSWQPARARPRSRDGPRRPGGDEQHFRAPTLAPVNSRRRGSSRPWSNLSGPAWMPAPQTPHEEAPQRPFDPLR